MPSLEGALHRLQERQLHLENHQRELQAQHLEDEALLEAAVDAAMGCCEMAARLEGVLEDGEALEGGQKDGDTGR